MPDEKEQSQDDTKDAENAPEETPEKLTADSDPDVLLTVAQKARQEAAQRRIALRELKKEHEALQAATGQMKTQLEELQKAEKQRRQEAKAAAEKEAEAKGEFSTIIKAREQTIAELQQEITSLAEAKKQFEEQAQTLGLKVAAFQAQQRATWELRKTELDGVDENIIKAFGLHLDEELTPEQVEFNLREIEKMRAAGIIGETPKGVVTPKAKAARPDDEEDMPPFPSKEFDEWQRRRMLEAQEAARARGA